MKLEKEKKEAIRVVAVSLESHKKLKVHAAKTDTSVSAIVEEAIREYFKKLNKKDG